VKNSETLILQDVWRKAFNNGDAGLTIKFPSKAGAVRARMQLYNAVKLQKAGKDMMDMNLVHAAEQLEIVWVDEVTIKLQRRGKSDMMVGIMAALGTTLEEYTDPEALESQERMLKELEALNQPKVVDIPKKYADEPDIEGHKDNPFFKRRG
jgi:hypothetical protein